MKEIYNNFKIEKMSETRTRYTYKQENEKGEKMVVELTRCDWGKLQKIWLDKKYLKNELKNWLAIDVNVTDEKGNCWGKYNPQHTHGNKINFGWVLEDTVKNREKILKKILKNFMNKE